MKTSDTNHRGQAPPCHADFQDIHNILGDKDFRQSFSIPHPEEGAKRLSRRVKGPNICPLFASPPSRLVPLAPQDEVGDCFRHSANRETRSDLAARRQNHRPEQHQRNQPAKTNSVSNISINISHGSLLLCYRGLHVLFLFPFCQEQKRNTYVSREKGADATV